MEIEDVKEENLPKIAIVGSGVVGKASGRVLSRKGYEVVFCDIDPEAISVLREAGYSASSLDSLKISDIDVLFISVSTPTTHQGVELSFIKSAVSKVGELTKDKKEYFVVVIRSTVPPGTTENIFIPLIEKYSGKKAGKDFGVCMNPEFLREASAEEDFENPRAIIIGAFDDRSYQALYEVYKKFDCPIEKIRIQEAEMQKYVHNIFNATKISFFNEMRETARRIDGLDTNKIFELVVLTAEGSWNHKYGTKDRGPYGGMCLPKDTTGFLLWFRQNFRKELPLLKAVIKVNDDLKEKENI